MIAKLNAKMLSMKNVYKLCYPIGKVEFGEQQNSCRPIALAWPRLDGLIQLFKHYFKIAPLSTNK
ncbi:MAG: hypothetical protein WBP84_09930, partial [Nitrososphaeraceae archaeon]